MPRQLKVLALSATMVVGSAAVAATDIASAESPAPSIVKNYRGHTVYPCSNGTCTIGPGDTRVPFAAVLVGTGGPEQSLESNSYKMNVVSGSLPPGLRLALPDAQWMILGTPTKAGTYDFTIQIADIAGGPDSTEKFSITIGPGADNIEATSASYLEKTERLVVTGFDVNVGATYTVYSGATGAKIGALQEEGSGDGERFEGTGGLTSS
jgi:hypothetical protein